AVSDSLTGRLEYISGTAQADREAVFTTQPNEAGSLILRWEIGGQLLPGKSGVGRFQARIRWERSATVSWQILPRGFSVHRTVSWGAFSAENFRTVAHGFQGGCFLEPKSQVIVG